MASEKSVTYISKSVSEYGRKLSFSNFLIPVDFKVLLQDEGTIERDS